MKKIITTLFLLMSMAALGNNNWETTNLGKYRVHPTSIERPFKNEYVFEFDIRYIEKVAPGMDHDIRLVVGDRILDVQEMKVITTTDCTNQMAIVKLTVPKNFANIDFDGISFVNKETKKIEKTFDIKGV